MNSSTRFQQDKKPQALALTLVSQTLKKVKLINREVIFYQVITGFKPHTFSTRARRFSHLSTPSDLGNYHLSKNTNRQVRQKI